ncbi:hypothetical protein F4678DRAFT_347959 [Xylaria arbuscula]|nr:hypothetical protein F4678DRAFT_347959 [Xylaria arbuscula]
MASTKMKSDKRNSPFALLSPASVLHEPTGTNTNPIVLDDDDDDDESEDDTRTRQPLPRLQQHVPSKKRKIPPVDDDASSTVTPPRTFDELLLPDSPDKNREWLDKMESIQSELASLHSIGLERDRMAEENATLSVILDAAKRSEEVYKTRAELLELEISGVQESLRSAKLQTLDALKEKDLLQKEVAAQMKLGKQQRDEIANMKKAEQHTPNEGFLAMKNLKNEMSEDLGELREAMAKIPRLEAEHDEFIAASNIEKLGVQQELEKANATISTLRTELSDTQKEHKAAKATVSSLLIKHSEFIATTRTESRVAKDEIKNLQSCLRSKETAYEILKVEMGRDMKHMKGITDERGELIKRINILESRHLADVKVIQRQTKALAEASTHATVKANLQARVDELEDHMKRCLIAQQPPEFWENECERGLEILGKTAPSA